MPLRGTVRPNAYASVTPTIIVSNETSAFRRIALPYLRRDPLYNTAILTAIKGVTQSRQISPFIVAVGPRDEVAGLAIHCPSQGWLASLLSDEAIHEVARAIATEDPDVRRLVTPSCIAAALAAEVARESGSSFQHSGGHRLHTLGNLYPAQALGSARLATIDDMRLCIEWLEAFDDEVGAARRPHGQSIESQIRAGAVWLWASGDSVVSLACHRPEIYGVVRIGPVYTPVSERNSGYAAALVSYVSERILAKGLTACLHTDVKNPAPAKIYAALGYHPIAEHAVYHRGEARSENEAVAVQPARGAARVAADGLTM